MSSPSPNRPRHTRRAPKQSVFYDRLVPIIFVALGILMLALIVIAAGVLFGFVQYR